LRTQLFHTLGHVGKENLQSKCLKDPLSSTDEPRSMMSGNRKLRFIFLCVVLCIGIIFFMYQFLRPSHHVETVDLEFFRDLSTGSASRIQS
ncbi:hypothetical protein TNCT_448471, partial [Trichonephila clavata]